MNKLLAKRIVMFFGLLAVISVLFVFQLQSLAEENRLMKYIVNRNQNQDYNRLFDRSIYKSFTITFTQENFDQLLTNMQAYYDLYGNYRDNNLIPVDVSYTDGTGESFTIYEVGFRTKSNTSRNLPLTYDWRGRSVYHQTSFQLQFNATHSYPQGTNEYEILRQRRVFDLRQINFEYALPFEGQDDDAMITEAYAHQLLRNAGLISQQASYGLVYLKIDQLVVGFGLYTFIEPIDSTFLNKFFSKDLANNHGDLYKATDIDGFKANLSTTSGAQVGININEANERYQYHLSNNTQLGLRTDFTSFYQFITLVNNPLTYTTNIGNVIDVDKFLRFIAMSYLIGNTDDFRNNGNNYYIYFQVLNNQAVFLSFDHDNALGFGKNQDLSDQYTVNYPLFLASDSLNPLIYHLLNQPNFQRIYLNYVEQFADQYMNYAVFHAEILQAKSLYEAELIAQNHLGNQVFGFRNSQWYFETKKNNAIQFVQEARTQLGFD
jgi:spore coat protein CotH